MNVLQMPHQNVRVYDKPLVITKETIKKTIQYVADNCQACIDEAVSGDVFVNDLDSYVIQKEEERQKYLSGNFDPWLGFWQRAIYIQTKESVPMLSR